MTFLRALPKEKNFFLQEGESFLYFMSLEDLTHSSTLVSAVFSLQIPYHYNSLFHTLSLAFHNSKPSEARLKDKHRGDEVLNRTKKG